MGENTSETKRLDVPKDGAVLVRVNATVTEREIVEDRSSIVARLHSAYLNLADHMVEF